MQTGCEFRVQLCIHRTRTFQPAHTGKHLGDHHDPVMGLAIGQVIPLRMAGMLGAVILNFQDDRIESRLQCISNSTSSGCHKCDTLRLPGVANQGKESTLRS